jgi:shikimate O-hydroxycinnamoyltransferase
MNEEMSTIPLSPMEYVFTGTGSHPIEFVFAYVDRIDTVRLRSSLEETLEHFPLLAGKIVRISDEAYGFRLDRCAPSFQTTHSSISFDDAENFYELLDPVASVEGEPLTRIKLTQTPKGSVLGVSISHALVDGFSYFHVLSSWSRIFKGSPIIAPIHNRELLIPEPSDHKEPVTPDDVLARSGLFWRDKRGKLERDRIHWERFFLSRRMLAELSRQSQTECNVRFSENDVIAAHLWKKYARQWSSGKGIPTAYLSCPVDIRRIPALLPKTYFGCAVCLVTTPMDYDELAASSLGKAALAIRSAVRSASSAYALGAMEVLQTLRRQEGLAILDRLHVMHPLDGLLVTNISRLPVADFDFGTGAPAGYRILTPAQRAAVILPAEDGVEIRVCHPYGGEPR